MAYRHKYYYVYILKCADGSYYTGFTNDFERRFAEHEEGFDTESYTYSRRPLELVYADYFTDPKQAIAFENKLKAGRELRKKP